MTDGVRWIIVSRSWISDTPDEVEHPTVPLGINEMAIPRAAILLSLATAALLIGSTIVVGYSVFVFVKENMVKANGIDRDNILASKVLFRACEESLWEDVGGGWMLVQPEPGARPYYWHDERQEASWQAPSAT